LPGFENALAGAGAPVLKADGVAVAPNARVPNADVTGPDWACPKAEGAPNAEVGCTGAPNADVAAGAAGVAPKAGWPKREPEVD
jgi:hypothetical protein